MHIKQVHGHEVSLSCAVYIRGVFTLTILKLKYLFESKHSLNRWVAARGFSFP